MKTKRAVMAGILVWTMIFSTFMVLSFIPRIKDSNAQQDSIVLLLLLLYSYLGARFYYRSGSTAHGAQVSGLMIAVMLTLDAIITVPVTEFPKGGGYASFYSAPILWALVLEHLLCTVAYWWIKVRLPRAVSQNAS